MILGRAPHHVREVDRLLLQLELPARDARDVEQIVDQAGQVRGLAIDD
jgi:hypothetical protein